MPLDVRNLNLLWASVLVETLVHLGAGTAITCPGSRSGPLTIALAQHPDLDTLPILDERSAAFFALGVGKRSGLPAPLVCTSGTAAAHFFPAVIEAHTSRIPMLILTADRPLDLRDCNSGQTIDQINLFGHYPNWQTEIALPEIDLKQLAYLRQTMVHAWDRTLFPTPGPVHLNIPFRDPLAPIPDDRIQPIQQLAAQLDPQQFFQGISRSRSQSSRSLPLLPAHPSNLGSNLPIESWQSSDRGLIIAGPAQPLDPLAYSQAVAQCAMILKWPVLAEGLSPLRNYADLNPYLISTYDLILRNQRLAKQLIPNQVIRLGGLPTSKVLRSWLDRAEPIEWVVDPGERNLDPLHGHTQHLHGDLEWVAKILSLQRDYPPKPISAYLNQWQDLESQARDRLDREMNWIDHLFEGKVAWILSQILPSQTPLFIANSMPIRDVEWFWQPGSRRIRPFCNRGANGIDGTLSTALGIAHHYRPTVLLTGDLALLHDSNGFLVHHQFKGHLTIILINNQGGGIFEMLPIANYDPPFYDYFVMPQAIDFGKLCQLHGVEYHTIQSWQQLIDFLHMLPDQGIRLLEIQTDRYHDAQWRLQKLDQVMDDSP